MSSSIDLGFINIHFYSLLILIGVLIGFKLAVCEGKKHGISENFMFNLVFWTFLFGVVGARLYFVLFNLDYYLNYPLEIIMVWNGGLAIHGGIIAGLITIVFYSHKYKVDTLRILDIIVVALILAQAIGRWGNFFNGEAHGPATTLAYLNSLHLPKFIIDGMYIDGVYYIPTFLYESIGLLIGFCILLFFRRRNSTKVGQVTALYLIWYGILRFFIESLRTDSLMIGSLKMAQLVSSLMLLIGIIMFIFIKFKSKNFYNEKER